MKIKTFVYILLFFLLACTTSKKATLSESSGSETTINQIYRESNPLINDLIHTKLEVNFNWDLSQLNGKANLKLKPYFYPTSELTLDAKGFDIKTVALITKNERLPLKYHYDSLKLIITLNKEYKKDEYYEIFIDYVANPDSLKRNGSKAIRSAKGLYFINPKNTEKNKPQQIWTQGETESNSCWFPTIDSPNEKMTQEIAITVDAKYTTLSNGTLIYSSINPDNTRTDYWAQNLPHAPYLAMMCIGEYAVIEDKWRGKEVNYYVEKEYAPYAKKIFGNTPEMLEFFSNKLGFDYPWVKYNQVVVRDFVSGAMENTGAVVFGEFVQRDSRELLDDDDEDIIAHELFHHWFGDLVTAESWSNLPLNESFATYGEILWIEHKYGKEAADFHLKEDMNKFFQEGKSKNVDLIRYYYDDKEDMFDRHTYEKGGVILHMLRNYVGDEAFFASLKKYLHDNKFKAVEIHNLRLAFEEVTGKDMNWFFNQWFLNKGYPHLDISYNYVDSSKKQSVIIQQIQDLNEAPLYRIPMSIDIYENGKKARHKIELTNQTQEFSFKTVSKPDLVNVDADKMLLCEKVDNKTLIEWIQQYKTAPLYADRYEAIEKIAINNNKDAINTMISALDDTFWDIRREAIEKLNYSDTTIKNKVFKKLEFIALNDSKSLVRATALDVLSKHYTLDSYQHKKLDIFEKAVTDSSYAVFSAALKGMVRSDSTNLLKISKYENTETSKILVALAQVYSEKGKGDKNDFYQKKLDYCKGFDQYSFIKSYNAYLANQNDSVITSSISFAENIARNNQTWYLRLAAIRIFQNLDNVYQNRIEKLTKNIRKASGDKKKELQLNKEKAIEIKKQVKTIFDDLLTLEKDNQVKKYFGN